MAVASLLLSACNTLQKTSTTADINLQTHSVTVADLKVGDRISYTMTPSDEVRRGGEANVKHVAEAEALAQKGGNADVLVEPSYSITKKRCLFGSKITSITVSGRPAFYTNFRPLPDSVLCNPVFRGLKTTAYRPVVRKSGNAAPMAVAAVNKSLRKKGMSMQFEIQWGGACSPDADYPVANFLVNPTYNINSQTAVGLGLGFNYQGDRDFWSIPFYAHARRYFSPSVKSWFVDARLGTDIPCYERPTAGAYVGLGVGYSFKYFEIAFRYNYSGCYVDYEDYDYDYGDYRMMSHSFYFHQPMLSLAWKF